MDKDSLYRSSFKCNINPGGSKSGTCDYCRNMNGKVFRLGQLVPTGKYNGDTGGYGHHKNCVCIFSKIDSGAKPGESAKKLSSATARSLASRGLGGAALGSLALGGALAYISAATKKKRKNVKEFSWLRHI